MIQLEGELFEAVQNPGVFKDSKTFVDAIPKASEEEILKAFQTEKQTPHFKLEKFLREYFILPHQVTTPETKINTDSMEAYIDSLWNTLEREPAPEQKGDTLIPLSRTYIVPGGRFREVYYWDSYFTAEGLATIGRFDLIESMIKNFIDLQTRFGLIPTANRQYYLTRSQPPVLGFMVNLLYQKQGADYIKQFIPALEKEHQFWMSGKHLVQLKNGAVLNRYYDSAPRPREESYLEDFSLGEKISDEEKAMFYQNIRSAAESGWDFSVRWFNVENDLSTIQTCSIIPVDLNGLLYGLEKLLEKYFDELGEKEKSNFYKKSAHDRQLAINTYLWSEEKGFYFDYNFKVGQQTDVYSMAAAVPLFVKAASSDQAEAVKKILEEQMLKQGGFVTTLIESGQQWDSPNGWAPLQWFGVKGLLNYGYDALAKDAMTRWVKMLRASFEKTKMLMEKYDVCEPDRLAGGGEYAVQEGFGWTNGIVLKFMELSGQ